MAYNGQLIVIATQVRVPGTPLVELLGTGRPPVAGLTAAFKGGRGLLHSWLGGEFLIGSVVAGKHTLAQCATPINNNLHMPDSWCPTLLENVRLQFRYKIKQYRTSQQR